MNAMKIEKINSLNISWGPKIDFKTCPMFPAPFFLTFHKGLAILVVGQGHEGSLDVTDFAVRNFQVTIQVVADAPPQVVQSHQGFAAAAAFLPASGSLVHQVVVGTIDTWAKKTPVL
jgi:hypothetical protein